MAFRELQAMRVAYELLAPLDPSAQQRAMAWLSAVLADTDGAPTAVEEPAAPESPNAETQVDTAPVGDVAEAAAPRVAAVPAGETGASAVSALEPMPAAEPEPVVEPGPVAEPARDPRPRRDRTAKPAGPSSRKAAKSAPPVPAVEVGPTRQGERPSGEQFLSDLGAVGSFKALAAKYGKSIGTIGNWANQLREQGFDIPVGRQKRG
jgi:hypothetical protein